MVIFFMNISMFDILGPVMIGPSSSHTAGAQRIGKAMYMICGGEPVAEVKFYLHGSFSHTLSGHGTDRALVAGLMGMEASDPRIKTSLDIAKEQGMKIEFEPADLGDVHPNTVKVAAKTKSGKEHVMIGSSVGGGEVEIVSIDGIPAKVSGKFPAVVVTHIDRLGVISKITSILAKNDINIVTVQHARENKGSTATTMIETDSPIPQEVKEMLEELDYIHNVVTIAKFA